MIIRFYRVLFGFLRVRFYGDFKERVLSLCAQNGIAIWGTKLTENGIESCISVNDFRYLRKIARGKGVKAHILKRRGIPFIVNRYKKRWGIAVGAFLFFVFLIVMSEYIWIIDVKGNNKITEGEILNACNSIGITSGIKKSSIYPKVEREKLMLRLDGVAWASLNIEGCRLTVNVTETKEKDNENLSYSNLIATCDGIIEKMDIVSGTSVVSVGQAVKKGDLLVSGIIETTDGTRFVKSKGTVIAKSQKEIVLRQDFEQSPLVLTGKVKTKRVINIFGIDLPLYLGEEKGDFETREKVNNITLFSSHLPIKIYEKKFLFKRKIKMKYNYDELCQRLEKELEKDIIILNKEFLQDEKGVSLMVIAEREENIAESDILLINAGN